VTAETACRLFEDGRKLFNEARFGLKFIEENSAEVFESDGFESLSRECLQTLLRSNQLALGEVDVFEAVNRWIEAELKRQSKESTPANRRAVIGDTIDLIRFPEMTMAEIVTKVQPTGLLTSEELLGLFTYLGASQSSRPRTKWIARPREGASGFFKDSEILSKDQQKIVNKFYSADGRTKWERVYHGKRDGYNAYAFHQKCDSVGPTLTVCRSTGNRNIFGGYTEQAWSGGGYKYDNKAFLFSIVNSRGKALKLPVNNPTYAINANSSTGPIFGNGNNLHVCNAMQSNGNYANTHDTYRLEDLSTGSYTQDLLAGQYQWTLDDIEVYKKKSS